MCGIVGYIGQKEAVKVLIDGLKRLEYRGYDSAGLAFIKNGDLGCIKAVGKIVELERKLSGNITHTNMGIAHTRWATHGAPTFENATLILIVKAKLPWCITVLLKITII